MKGYRRLKENVNANADVNENVWSRLDDSLDQSSDMRI